MSLLDTPDIILEKGLEGVYKRQYRAIERFVAHNLPSYLFDNIYDTREASYHNKPRKGGYYIGPSGERFCDLKLVKCPDGWKLDPQSDFPIHICANTDHSWYLPKSVRFTRPVKFYFSYMDKPISLTHFREHIGSSNYEDLTNEHIR